MLEAAVNAAVNDRAPDVVPAVYVSTDRIGGEVLDAMARLLQLHRPGDDGLCLGCEELWARYVWHAACPLATWARQVVAAHARTYLAVDELVRVTR